MGSIAVRAKNGEVLQKLDVFSSENSYNGGPMSPAEKIDAMERLLGQGLPMPILFLKWLEIMRPDLYREAVQEMARKNAQP